MAKNNSLDQRCSFETKRLLIKSWKFQVAKPSSESEFAKIVIKILSKKVTKSLPDGWQEIDSIKKAIEWIKNRAEESTFLIVQLNSTLEVVGFLFLYESNLSDKSIELRLGYLLSESVWGRGLGSELIRGLVQWCEDHSDITSISCGIESENLGSIKVLEKNGFVAVLSKNTRGNVIFMERKLYH